jgi:methyltransferase-like protein
MKLKSISSISNFYFIYSISTRFLPCTSWSRWCSISKHLSFIINFYKNKSKFQTLDQFVENFYHKLVLIFHVIFHFYILDKLDYVHEFQAIDEYMANKINDHKVIEQHHELFQDRSK